MGRIIFFGIFSMAFLFGGCHSNLIIVKNKGQMIGYAAFAHEKFKVYQSNPWFYRTKLDSIHLDSLKLPSVFKKYLRSNNQERSEIIYNGSNRTLSRGNIFLIYQKISFDFDMDRFTRNHANLLKNQFKIKDIHIEYFSNLTDTSQSIVPFVYPSLFMQNTKFSTLCYEIQSQKDSFAVIECQIPVEHKPIMLKIIYIINILNYKKELNLPDLWRKTFEENTLNWIATIDTTPSKRLTNRNVNNLYNYADSLLLRYGHQATLDSLLYLNNNYTQSHDFQSKSYYYQILMTYYSFMGKNDSSLKYQAMSFPKKTLLDTVAFHPKVLKKDAVAFIAEKYGHQSVIMINEAHNRGQNRYFAKQLLSELYKKGFRYLAIEGLAYEDTLVQSRGYPIFKTGIYIKEPAFGQMIRQALSLGFKLVAYESRLPYNPELSMIEGQNRREIEQANNIATLFKKNPDAKLLVYAGHGHIYKKPQGNWVRMGELLSKLLNYDIPSVECTEMMEMFEQAKENPYYRKAATDYLSTEPFVLIEKDTPFVKSSLKGYADVQVFFPKTDYTDGYPNWLKETNNPTYNLLIDKSLQNKHLLIYRADEWLNFKNQAIPVLQTTINTNVLKLYLKKGKYRAYVFKRGYDDILFEKEFNIYN